MADFFEAALKEYPQAKKIANWLAGPVLMELIRHLPKRRDLCLNNFYQLDAELHRSYRIHSRDSACQQMLFTQQTQGTP